jgi:hypothetical protein
VKQVFPNNNWKGDFIEERLNVSLNELSAENAEINKITYITNARSGDITTAIVEYYKEVE